MPGTRLGGIKVFENRAFLSWSGGRPEALGELCAHMAADRHNMGLLTHFAGLGNGESITAACALRAECFAGYPRREAGGCGDSWKISDNICRVSLYPHGQKTGIAAVLIRLLHENGTRVHAVCSSPSAVTIVISSVDFRGTMEKLFDFFEFPSYASFPEWHAVHREQEIGLQTVRCSYHEQVIHIYDFSRRVDLDLWNLVLPADSLPRLADVLFEMDGSRQRVPFLLFNPFPKKGELSFSFSAAIADRRKVERILCRNLPGAGVFLHGPMTFFFLHGPHFGDRYGIANALVSALQRAGIRLIALSCTVASISFAVEGDDQDGIVEALKPSFQTPGGMNV